MIRRLIYIACALALPGCTIAPASERSLALVRPLPVRVGEIPVYSDLCDVLGAVEVIGELEVANRGRKRAAIEHELVTLAARRGADAIVLHPFSRRAFGAAYTSADANSFNPFRYSRATAVRVSRTNIGSKSASPGFAVSAEATPVLF